MKPDQYRSAIEKHLGEELFRHSLGVAEAAAALAKRFGADGDKAYLAGLVHDYAKRYSRQELLEIAARLNLRLDRITRQEARLLHAPVGAVLIKKELGLKDPAVIQAVRRHTTGSAGMTLLDKVVYLADYIESGRDYEGVEKVRSIARENLDRALLEAVEQAIVSVLKRGLPLHPRSVVFRNCLLHALNDKSTGKRPNQGL